METGKEDEIVFQFYVSFVQPLIANLRDEREKDTAIKWLQKIAASKKSPLRIKYLKFLLYMLQMGRLMCPFDVEVEIDTELDDMAEDVTEQDMYNYVMIKLTGRRPTGEVTLPAMSTLSKDEQDFQAVQVIPSVGVRCYFAISTLPMKRWFQPPETLATGDGMAEEVTGSFQDYIQEEARRRLIDRSTHQPTTPVLIPEEHTETPSAAEESPPTSPPTSPLPIYFDPSERALPTTDLPVTITPPPTRLVTRKREPTNSADDQLLDVEEPEYEIQPVRGYKTGRDLIELDEEGEEDLSPRYRRLQRIMRDLEDVFPCPTTATPTQKPKLVCPRHLRQQPPLSEIVAEFENIPTASRPQTTNVYDDQRPIRRQRERPSYEDERPIQPSRGKPSYEDERPIQPSRERPSYEDERPIQPSRERPSYEDERPIQPSRKKPSYEDERPIQPSRERPSYEDERPIQPSRERPSYEDERPIQPSREKPSYEDERPIQPSREKPSYEDERPIQPSRERPSYEDERPIQPSRERPSYEDERPIQPSRERPSYEDERPIQPSREKPSYEDERPIQPSREIPSYEDERPIQPSRERPSYEDERPIQPSRESPSYEDERPIQPSRESPSYEDERPIQPSRERPSYEDERPIQPSRESPSYEDERPIQPSRERPSYEEEQPITPTGPARSSYPTQVVTDEDSPISTRLSSPRFEDSEDEARSEDSEEEARFEDSEDEGRLEDSEDEAQREYSEYEARFEDSEDEDQREDSEDEGRLEDSEDEAQREYSEYEARFEDSEDEDQREEAEEEACPVIPPCMDDTPVPADEWPDGEPLQKIIDALLMEPLQFQGMKYDIVEVYIGCKSLPDEFLITWPIRKDFIQFTRQYLFDVFRNSDLPSERKKGTYGFPETHDFDNRAYSQNAILRMIVVDNIYSVVTTLSVEELDFFLDFIQQYPYDRPRNLISSTIGPLGSTSYLDPRIEIPIERGETLPLPRPKRTIVTTTTTEPTTSRPRTTRKSTTTRPRIVSTRPNVTRGRTTVRPRGSPRRERSKSRSGDRKLTKNTNRRS